LILAQQVLNSETLLYSGACDVVITDTVSVRPDTVIPANADVPVPDHGGRASSLDCSAAPVEPSQ